MSKTRLNTINTSFLLPKPWKSMENAPKDDTEIWILAMELPAQINNQLPYVIRKTSYHPDAGYLIAKSEGKLPGVKSRTLTQIFQGNGIGCLPFLKKE